MTWKQLIITTSPASSEYISDILLVAGAVSVSFLDAGDQPIYASSTEEVPLWDDVQVQAIFSDEIDLQQLVTLLKNDPEITSPFRHEIQEFVDQDWSKSWLNHFQPMCFGEKFWITSSAHPEPQDNLPKIKLDPGLAFGTGTHPTTYLCLQWLAEHMQGGETVIDYGCGSGILALAAAKLGAKCVYAIDNDPQAVQASEMNARANQISSQTLHVGLPDQLPAIKADILIANILANPLMVLAPLFAEHVKSKGKIVLSGILEPQSAEIIAAYKPWFYLSTIVQKEEWVLISGERIP